MKTHKGLKKLVSVEGKLHFTCGPTAKKKKKVGNHALVTQTRNSSPQHETTIKKHASKIEKPACP